METEGVTVGAMLARRYAVGRTLGRGGFGVVHEAHDTLLDVPLALKVLTRGPAHVADLKREFRAASALCHPNVVALHELSHDAGHWFLTMELLEGSRLGEWLGGAAPETRVDTFAASSAYSTISASVGDETAQGGVGSRCTPASTEQNPAAIAHVFAQIADALAFIHEAGATHCDLKPSNVLVTAGDRPVIVDFGLARMFAPRSGGTTGFQGTPLYAAPEQLAGRSESPAIDLFALGTMLFEALAGFLPFVGTTAALVVAKQARRAAPLGEATPDVAAPLARLVDALLDPDPGARPSARDAARVLRGEHDVRAASVVPTTFARRHDDSALVGREAELPRLAAAVSDARTLVTVVRGPSGIGKSALVEATAASVAARGALVLQARCFERESGPFEVLDGVCASLFVHLDDGLLASDDTLVDLLGEVAPLVPSVAARSKTPRATHRGPEEERERAAEGFARLVGHLAATQRLVIRIDDLQWIDADSAWVLARLFHGSRGTSAESRIAFLVTHRPHASGADQGAELLDALAPTQKVVVDLAPLDRSAAEQLLRSRLEKSSHLRTRLESEVTTILAHAGGNPLLLRELGDLAAELGPGGAHSLSDVVAARMLHTSVSARSLFELVALAMRPVEEGVLLRVAMRGDGSAAELTRGLLDLVHAGLVRSEGRRPGAPPRLTVAHAALGRAVLERLTHAAVRDHHVAWAETLERVAPDSEAETIARHWVAAAEDARAVRFLRHAAESATRAFAFSRARELYEAALRLAPTDGRSGATSLLIPLGDVLAADGRGAQAARVYGRAANLLGGDAALDLERRAAEQLLKSGHIREGTEALDRVIANVGMRRSRTRPGALFDLVRSRVRARRVRWPLDPANTSLDAVAGRRADAALSLASGLGFVDPIVAADFSTRHYLEAVQSNDPLRRLRAMTGQAIAAAGEGEPSRHQVAGLLFDAAALAEQLGTPRARAYLVGAEAISSALLGDFGTSFDACTRVDAIFTSSVRDAPWEHVTMLHMMMWSAFHAGRIDVIAERAPSLFDRHVARGDHYGATGLAANYANLAWLVGGADAATHVLDDCAAFWRGEAFNLLSYDIELARVHVSLATGDAEGALRRAESATASLERALFHHVGAMRLDSSWMRARAIVAACAGAKGLRRVALRARAERAIVAISRAPIASAPALASLLRACLKGALDDAEGARAGLDRAAIALERAGLALLATLARRSAALASGRPPPADVPHAALLTRVFLPALPHG